MEKIVTSLLMKEGVEEAAKFYVSLFRDSRIVDTSYYGDAVPGSEGKVLAVTFELAGQPFIGINGPDVPFTDAVSLMIRCEDQAEVDRYWSALTADGGSEGQCGWCKDRYGLSWQVVPKTMDKILAGPDKAGASRAMAAMMKMKKLDGPELERAYAG